MIKFLFYIQNIILRCHGYYTEFKVWRRLSSSVKLKPLTRSQKAAINRYYQPLIGKKLNPKWHQLLYSITGVFNPRYLSWDVYGKMIYNLSPWGYKKIIDDKNLYEALLEPSESYTIPLRKVKCMCGVYQMQKKGKLTEVSKDEAIRYASNLSNCIIKPSRDSSSGLNVKSFDTKDGIETNTGKCLQDFLRSYGQHFLIEEKIKEHANLSALNPTSVNTLRIITYRTLNEGVVLLKAYLRIGKKGQVVDNAHAGGITANIDKQKGCLDFACSIQPYKSFDKTENGITIKGYLIEGLDQMVAAIKEAHERLPMFDIIGWDVARDEKGRCVILEFNPDVDLRMDQVLGCDTFLGDWQEEILKRVYSKQRKG